MLQDQSKRKVGKAGRRGGKTVWEIAEAGVTCVDQGGRCGWGAPNFPILRDAWRELKTEFAPFIREVREAEWTLIFESGGMLECWSFDAGIIARSRQYDKFIIDEAGLIANLAARFNAEIEPTLGDRDGALVAASSPNIVGPDFSRWYELGQTPGSGWKSWKWTSLDNPAVAENMARIIEGARARGVPEWVIQQEYFAEETQDDTGFFPKPMIARCKAEHGREPVAVGWLECGVDDVFERESVVTNRQVGRLQWRDDPYGPWRFWQWWEGKRPPQDAGGLSLGAGVDLSWGVGASNSVCSLANADTREKIAELVSPELTPEEVALRVGMMAYWLGGRPGRPVALVNFEANGPGEKFAKQMQAMKFGSLFRERKAPTAVESDDPGRIGWRSGQTAKRIMLDEYRAALATGRFTNPSIPALDECLTYHQDGKGVVMTEREWAGLDKGDTARAPHGDRVIADGLCWLACQSLGRAPLYEHPALPGTLAGAIKKQADARKARERW